MIRRYIQIQNVSIQSASSQEPINLRNEILEQVSLASDGGKPSSSVHITNIHTKLSTKHLSWYVFLRDLCRVFNTQRTSDA